MSYLVRKINRAKWKIDSTNLDTPNAFQGDAITNCLRTYTNKISTWEINSRDEIDKAFLALLATHNNTDTFDIVLLDKEEIKKLGFDIDNSQGKTPYEEMNENHRDIIEITYKSLGTLANLTYLMINDENCIRRTESKLTKLLNDAIKDGKIKKSELSVGLQERVNDSEE